MTTPTPDEVRVTVATPSSVAATVVDGISRDTGGLRRAVEDVARGVSGSGGGKGNLLVVKPSASGVWPAVDRDARTVVWWLRHYGDGMVAPMPTAGQGYVSGDFVTPPPVTSAATMVWSDSLVATTNAHIAGRAGDGALGGASPSWASAAPAGDTASEGRARIMVPNGLEVYSGATAWVDSPRLPSGRPIRVKFNVTDLGDGHRGGILVRGSTPTDTSGVVLQVRRSGSAAEWSLYDRSTDATTAFSTGTYRAGAPVVVVLDGTNIDVTWDGTPLQRQTVPLTRPIPDTVAVTAPLYLAMSVNNMSVEAL